MQRLVIMQASISSQVGRQSVDRREEGNCWQEMSDRQEKGGNQEGKSWKASSWCLAGGKTEWHADVGRNAGRGTQKSMECLVGMLAGKPRQAVRLAGKVR
jgi:hypothetical protein